MRFFRSPSRRTRGPHIAEQSYVEVGLSLASVAHFRANNYFSYKPHGTFVKNPNSDSGNNSGDRKDPHHKPNNNEGSRFQPPEGGLEKSDAIERQIPRPGKDVEKKMGENMPDRK
jgi:hypothetical protein